MRRICIGAGVVEWVARRTNEYGNFGAARGIGIEENVGSPAWRIIAGVAYSQWNGPNVVCDIASDGSRRWMTRKFLWTIFDYPFNQLKCSRITVCVGEANTDSRRFVEHLGFELEARLEKAHPTGDLLIYCVRKPRVQRWLNLKRESHAHRLAA